MEEERTHFLEHGMQVRTMLPSVPNVLWVLLDTQISHVSLASTETVRHSRVTNMSCGGAARVLEPEA